MSLRDYKITDEAIAQNGVIAAPDKLTGTAAQNKAVFDRLIRESVKGLFNSVVETLAGTGGAAAVGTAPITGVTGEDVQTALGSLKLLLDAKSDKADTDLHVRSVSFNAATGVLTFTHEDGSYTTIDTALEKVATNWQYDAETQSLVLTLADGSTQSVPLSAFITETEFTDSSQIAFSVSDHQVTATVKAGSITDTMLASALVTQLQGYVSSASSSAADALTYRNAAEGFRDSASQKAESAASSETAAGESETAAAESAVNARSYAVGGTGSRTGEDTDNAKYYCEQAAHAAGGGVVSFNNRSGSVTAQAGDYSPSMVGAAPDVGKGVNLLDNWYFIGGGSQQGGGQFPINQRGQTSYTGTIIGMDRWKGRSNSTNVRITASGAILSASSAGYGFIHQYMENRQNLYGETVTLSALTEDGLAVGTGMIPASIPETESRILSGTAGDLVADLYIWTNGTLLVQLYVDADKSSTIKAVKLELGSAQTLARQVNGAWVLNDPPPNYQQELARCQRYYQLFRTQSWRAVYAADFRPVMRADPALVTVSIGGVTYYAADAEL